MKMENEDTQKRECLFGLDESIWKNFHLNFLFGFSVLFILIMAFFGSLLFSTLLHEMQHQRDFSNYGPYEEEICLLNVPAEGNALERVINSNGYYSFRSGEFISSENKLNSEFKAYSISFFVLGLFFVSGYYVFKGAKFKRN